MRLFSSLLLLHALLALPGTAAAAAETTPPGVDPLWLRYPEVVDRAKLLAYREVLGGGVKVSAASAPGSAALEQLHAAVSELQIGLSGLLGQPVSAHCCAPADGASGAAALAGGTLAVNIGNTTAAEHALGSEGFRISRSPAGQYTLSAASPSGALYGAFRLLGYLQRAEPLPEVFTSVPAMKLRVFDLWDELDGAITRGFAGKSLVWPFALFDDARPPPRDLLYLAACNATDPHQKWQGATLTAAGAGKPSTVRNVGTGTCLGTLVTDPTHGGGPCTGAAAAQFLYNAVSENPTRLVKSFLIRQALLVCSDRLGPLAFAEQLHCCDCSALGRKQRPRGGGRLPGPQRRHRPGH